MAYGFGTGVQAGLGATDYSNYLRGALSGAQMEAQGSAAIGQGIQNALGSIASGIAMRGERKEKMAERDRLLAEQEQERKGNIDFASSAIKDYMEDQNISPFTRESLGGIYSQITDENIPVAQRNSIAKNIGTIISLADKAQNKIDEQGVNNYTIFAGKLGEDATDETALNLGFTPRQINRGKASFMQMQQSEAEILKTLAAATPKPGPVANIFPTADAALMSIPEGNRKDYNVKFNPTLGGYFPEPITSGERVARDNLNFQNEKYKLEQDQAKVEELARIDSSRYSLGIARDTVDKAISLSQLGAGGGFQGLPFVRGTTAAIGPEIFGAGQSKTLASYLDTLKSVLTVENLKELKQLSTTGASGFGSLSDKEGEILASTIAKLDPTMSESVLQENLRTIGDLLDKMRGRPTELSNEAKKYLR
jgi:hypothetical protein